MRQEKETKEKGREEHGRKQKNKKGRKERMKKGKKHKRKRRKNEKRKKTSDRNNIKILKIGEKTQEPKWKKILFQASMMQEKKKKSRI